jgi:hypothetical protein
MVVRNALLTATKSSHQAVTTDDWIDDIIPELGDRLRNKTYHHVMEIIEVNGTSGSWKCVEGNNDYNDIYQGKNSWPYVHWELLPNKSGSFMDLYTKLAS